MKDEKSPFEDYDVKEGLKRFYKQLDESYTVLIPERVEGSEKFLRAVRGFASAYGMQVDIRKCLYFIEASFREMGGPYPRQFSREFTALLAMGDRFEITGTTDDIYNVTIAIQYDTHDYYFNGKKFNETW